MKKILFFFLFSISVSVNAQTSVYHPFPDSNAIWMETMWWIYWGPSPIAVDMDYVLFIGGDTLINTNIYKKLLSSGYSHPHLIPNDGANYYVNQYQGAYREDTSLKKVFFIPPLSSSDALLYDFNLSLGDTVPDTYNNYPNSNYISSVDSILIGADYRKRYWVSVIGSTLPGDSAYASIIEGMGSTYGLLNILEPWFEGGSYLHCFTVNNQTIYLDSNWVCNLDVGTDENKSSLSSIQLFPNPTRDFINLKNNFPFPLEATVFSSLGNAIFKTTLAQNGAETINVSDWAAGIYLVAVKSEKNFAVRKFMKQ